MQPPPTAAQLAAAVFSRKAELRQELKSRRARLTVGEKESASQKIAQLLEEWLVQEWWPAHPGATVGVFLARSVEPNLDGLYSQLLQRGVPLAAPRVDMEHCTMGFFPLPTLTCVELGPWAVRQPLASPSPVWPQLALVPGLGFDGQGGRLGMGGGWYDRVLPRIAAAVGVCFAVQMVPSVPQAPHDCRVHSVATELGWREAKAV